ncbi:hypothetical protein AKO1_011820, partial [Acrasis kona]
MNILVATPGRLLQHMDSTVGFSADNLAILVLDEADRLLEPGFKQELNSVLTNLPKERQTLLFSATQTKSVKDLARLSLKKSNTEYVSVHEAEPVPTKLVQTFIECELFEKVDVLFSFIKSHLKNKIVVFVSTMKQVKYFQEVVKLLLPQIISCKLSGSMSQKSRREQYEEFCASRNAVLFATDIAARGLDFPRVDFVVQLDIPVSTQAYIHRVGRTARLHAEGKSIMIVTPQDNSFLQVLEDERHISSIKETKVNPSHIVSIKDQLSALLSFDVNLKLTALRYYESYLRHVNKNHKAGDKVHVNVRELPLDDFAQRLGLASKPSVKLIKNDTRSEDVQSGQDEQMDEEDDDEEEEEEDDEEVEEAGDVNDENVEADGSDDDDEDDEDQVYNVFFEGDSEIKGKVLEEYESSDSEQEESESESEEEEVKEPEQEEEEKKPKKKLTKLEKAIGRRTATTLHSKDYRSLTKEQGDQDEDDFFTIKRSTEELDLDPELQGDVELPIGKRSKFKLNAGLNKRIIFGEDGEKPKSYFETVVQDLNQLDPTQVSKDSAEYKKELLTSISQAEKQDKEKAKEVRKELRRKQKEERKRLEALRDTVDDLTQGLDPERRKSGIAGGVQLDVNNKQLIDRVGDADFEIDKGVSEFVKHLEDDADEAREERMYRKDKNVDDVVAELTKQRDQREREQGIKKRTMQSKRKFEEIMKNEQVQPAKKKKSTLQDDEDIAMQLLQ